MHDVKRDAQLRKWINEGPEDSTPVHEDVVMWGVWFVLGDDEYKPPTALFGSEEDAKAFATLMHAHEWDVSPCIVDLKTRDDYLIPEPEAAS